MTTYSYDKKSSILWEDALAGECIKAIAAGPDDLAAHQALADHLSEEGHPLGEFMQLSLALENPTTFAQEKASVAARRAELLNQHLDAIVGDDLAAFLRTHGGAADRLT